MGKAEQQFGHLTDAQIEHYGDRTSGEGPNQNGLEVDQAIETHLADCAGCRIRVLEFHRSRFGLMSDPFPSAARQSHPPTAECPSEDAVCNLAAGISSSAEAPLLTQHAAQCPHCGPILRAYTEDFSDDLSPEDQALLSKLKSSSPEWQQKMAERMAAAVSVPATSATRPSLAAQHSPSEEDRVAQPPSAVNSGLSTKSTPSTKSMSRPGFFRLKWILTPAALGAAAVIAFFIWNAQRETPEKVGKLLAQAYTEQRTMEMRIDDARYGPIRVLRGDEQSHFQRPIYLIDAESKIARGLRRDRDKEEWLKMKARAELLNGNYTAAIETLSQFNEPRNDPRVLCDMAAAYYQRATAESQPTDFSVSVELLSEALQKDPHNEIALYNRALVYEKLFLYREAIKDWEQYFSVRRDKTWDREANSHLAKLKEALQRSQRYRAPLLDYQTFVKQVSAGEGVSWSNVDARIEAYFQSALVEWLPIATKNGNVNAPTARRALQVLGTIALYRHHDTWFNDFLSSPETFKSTEAAQDLSDAIRFNSLGHSERAIFSAQRAALLFGSSGNIPGNQRARTEWVYALHRAVRSPQCTQGATKLLREMESLNYFWMRGQLLIEKSVCEGMLEHLDSSFTAIHRALQIVGLANYPELHMRALGISGSFDTETGRPNSAWKKDFEGLTMFWDGTYSGSRAYQFYSDLGFLAESTHDYSTSLAIAREAVAEAKETKNTAVEALAYYRLANDAVLAKQEQEALKGFAAAETNFLKLPQDQTVQTYILDGKISIAELNTERQLPDVTVNELQRAAQNLPYVANYSIRMRFHNVMGQLFLQEGLWVNARASFSKAVSISEFALKSFHTEAERLKWDVETSRAYRGLLLSYLRGGIDRTTALEYWEWYKGAPIRQRQVQDDKSLERMFSGANRVNRSRQFLKTQTVVSYAELPDSVMIWVFDDRGLYSSEIKISQVELGNLSRTFVEQCSNPNSNLSLLKSNGRALYDLLIRPVRPYLSNNRELLIEGDGDISTIPFQAMVDSEGKYVGDTFSILMSPGIYYWQDRQPLIYSSELRSLIVDSPTLSPNEHLIPLPEATAEADAIAARFIRPQRLSGSAATLGAIKTALATAQVFHFAGHASNNFRYAGLIVTSGATRVLSESTAPAVLNASEVSRLDLRRIRLAVLSSCPVSNNPRAWMEDPDGLARALLISGVSNVVVSKWDVDSRSTSEIMNIFYGALLSGMTPAHALQRAEAELRNTPDYSHPHFWASFYSFTRN